MYGLTFLSHLGGCTKFIWHEASNLNIQICIALTTSCAELGHKLILKHLANSALKFKELPKSLTSNRPEQDMYRTHFSFSLHIFGNTPRRPTQIYRKQCDVWYMYPFVFYSYTVQLRHANIMNSFETCLYWSVNAFTNAMSECNYCFCICWTCLLCLDFWCFVVFYSSCETKRNCHLWYWTQNN